MNFDLTAGETFVSSLLWNRVPRRGCYSLRRIPVVRSTAFQRMNCLLLRYCTSPPQVDEAEIQIQFVTNGNGTLRIPRARLEDLWHDSLQLLLHPKFTRRIEQARKQRTEDEQSLCPSCRPRNKVVIIFNSSSCCRSLVVEKMFENSRQPRGGSRASFVVLS